jgi:hypothetical protein
MLSLDPVLKFTGSVAGIGSLLIHGHHDNFYNNGRLRKGGEQERK